MINYFSFWLAEKHDRCSRMGVKRITAPSSSKRAIKILTATDCVWIKNTLWQILKSRRRGCRFKLQPYLRENNYVETKIILDILSIHVVNFYIMLAKVTRCIVRKKSGSNFWLFGRRKMTGVLESTIMQTLSEKYYIYYS